MPSINELLFVTLITITGMSTVTGLLYFIYKKTLTYKLWVGLTPGVFAFTYCMYIWGSVGVHNIVATGIVLLLGVTIFVGDLVLLARKIAIPL